ncbi:omega-hydroxypalmitate O-feruloyl transferase [Phalaenopsis equestris]|uniref:omega-hydroxypalmitate O-feruloyl transferase n=1 Tax=Phalaenopsis equestris TaxID=78828 RepID=UPI0009E4C5FC|nr:omega-hydroxypalmitate O-feruloyl transferase [Phalaenopsis equestris]
MGSHAVGNGDIPLLQDFKLTILSSSILHPSGPMESRSTLFLSNIDQILNFNVETIHFFAANPDFPPETVAEKLRSAVKRVLVPYDFLAGRLIRLEGKEGRLEIDCNSAGVEFLVAESELRLDQIGELEYPNPAFRQLAAAGAVREGLKMEDRFLCSFQLTFFKCGGFALGISNNHVTFDGISFKNFLQNLAFLAAGDHHRLPLPIPPFTNRHLLSTRSPPRVTFSHPELIETPFFSTILEAEPSPSNLRFKLLRLSAADISSLKLLVQPRATRATSFNVVVAHLWRCKMRSLLPESSPEDLKRASMVLYAVDIRKKVSPPLPPGYAGNAVLTAYGAAAREEVAGGEFGKLVEAVAKGAERMDDEYARSVIDWGAVYRGLPKGDMFVSSWWRLGFADVDFPWGKALYTCPVADPKRDVALLLPSIGGAEDGVNVLVALQGEEMDRFEEYFYKLLPKDE